MRVAFAAITLSLPASVLAQACSVNPPAFVVSCPCPGSRPILAFTGTARIGTMQRFSATSDFCHPGQGYLIIGPPLSVPLRVPDGLVLCGSTMSPVTSLPIDPVYVAGVGAGQVEASGCLSFFPYFLFVP